MYEFHGWATIREITSDVDAGSLELIINDIRIFIRSLSMNSSFIDLHSVNGEYHLTVSGLTNHKRQETEAVFRLFKYVAQNARGSYGILYVKDDEDENGKSNIFQVYVLVRGNVQEKKDEFLSPVVPMVEDEFE